MKKDRENAEINDYEEEGDLEEEEVCSGEMKWGQKKEISVEGWCLRGTILVCMCDLYVCVPIKIKSQGREEDEEDDDGEQEEGEDDGDSTNGEHS